jgi:hypothetical protein
MFRDIAKAIHPDRAHNSAARDRRHSLMAEANRRMRIETRTGCG